MIKPQQDFPYLKEFKQKFPTTDRTIFIFEGNIFTNYELDPDIMVHEIAHLERQHKIGAKKWIKKYLKSPKFRLKEEIYAYKKQLEAIPSEDYKDCLDECAINLSSELYGNLMTYDKAINELNR